MAGSLGFNSSKFAICLSSLITLKYLSENPIFKFKALFKYSKIDSFAISLVKYGQHFFYNRILHST